MNELPNEHQRKAPVITPLKEGLVRKGGINPLPASPPPAPPPPPPQRPAPSKRGDGEK